MSSDRDFEAADGERGRWIDARTIEVLEVLGQHWGGHFDEARVRELGTAYLGLRGSTEALSEDDRFSLLNGAAMALLGEEYRPPSPTSLFSASVDLNAGFKRVDFVEHRPRVTGIATTRRSPMQKSFKRTWFNSSPGSTHSPTPASN